MKRQFKTRLNNIASVQPAVADFLYKELALDASVARNPIMQQRMKLIFLGNEELIQDLRVLNGSAKDGTFEPFFQEMAKVVEEVTVADDRRHNEAHLSAWISVRDLMEKCIERCPENTLIPSKSLVPLQFSPKNPYSKTALAFSSKLQVQYKVQRRQLRTTHPDQLYAAAQFKYLRELAVELTKDKAVLLFADDKAKIPIGEPGHTVSTGVRGKKTLSHTGQELLALDHDMNVSSLTPSVVLRCDTPEELNHSFVQGHVTVTVNDSVFLQSSPWRHSAIFAKLLREMQQKTLLLFTDGGTDHRHTLELVRLSLICLCVDLNLDMIVAGRCAPGQSFTNPAERVMSILNLGLQNCSLERSSMNAEKETIVKRCNAMKTLRTRPEIRQDWTESLENVTRIISNRFRRLRLKEDPIEVWDHIPDDDIDLIKRHARELFPNMDLSTVTKATTSKCNAYLSWKEKHCRERHYTFQIRKCDDAACCLPKSEDCPNDWLPDPVLNDTKEHYKQYNEVKGTETVDGRPSLTIGPKPKTATKRTAPPAEDVDVPEEEVVENDICPLSTQTAGTIATCVECRKPRVVYSKQKMSTERQRMTLAMAMSEFDFTCGAPLLPPDHSMSHKLVVRPFITCALPVEIPYYGAQLGPIDICAFCGGDGADPKTEMKKKFKTVLPICIKCEDSGLKAIVARPYGKK